MPEQEVLSVEFYDFLCAVDKEKREEPWIMECANVLVANQIRSVCDLVGAEYTDLKQTDKVNGAQKAWLRRCIAAANKRMARCIHPATPHARPPLQRASSRQVAAVGESSSAAGSTGTSSDIKALIDTVRKEEACR